ncbi:MAG TPA: DUF5667 domain-containing protein [Candidatus Sulfotelmatobacter sp.]|nr:DUF5667 domain-containing protein [Candidatus Sulfotelmatobacter sp.]
MNRLLGFFLIFLLLSFASVSFASGESQKVSYDLPYPGILPNNPLYFLKAVRDNFVGYLISEPLKKSEYDLLQSDKRLVSSQKLLEEGNAELSITTLSKSGNYFYSAIENAAFAKSQGKDATPILDKMLNASKKHQEIISEMVQKAKEKNKPSFVDLLKRTKSFQEKVEQIKSK